MSKINIKPIQKQLPFAGKTHQYLQLFLLKVYVYCEIQISALDLFVDAVNFETLALEFTDASV